MREWIVALLSSLRVFERARQSFWLGAAHFPWVIGIALLADLRSPWQSVGARGALFLALFLALALGAALSPSQRQSSPFRWGLSATLASLALPAAGLFLTGSWRGMPAFDVMMASLFSGASGLLGSLALLFWPRSSASDFRDSQMSRLSLARPMSASELSELALSTVASAWGPIGDLRSEPTALGFRVLLGSRSDFWLAFEPVVDPAESDEPEVDVESSSEAPRSEWIFALCWHSGLSLGSFSLPEASLDDPRSRLNHAFQLLGANATPLG